LDVELRLAEERGEARVVDWRPVFIVHDAGVRVPMNDDAGIGFVDDGWFGTESGVGRFVFEQSVRIRCWFVGRVGERFFVVVLDGRVRGSVRWLFDRGETGCAQCRVRVCVRCRRRPRGRSA
jgi:hypothetical protein